MTINESLDDEWAHCFHSLPSDNYKNSIVNDRLFFSPACFFFKLKNDMKFSLLVFVFVGLIAFEIMVNLTVLVSIILEKTKKRIDLCFASNAIADLMIGLVIMPFTGIYTIFGYFPMGTYTCFAWNILDFTVGTVSMLHILYISYDRYLSVSKPLKYTHKSRDKFSMSGIPTYVILLFFWFFSLALWLPVILYLKSTNPIPLNHLVHPNSTFLSIIRTKSSDEPIVYDCSVPATPAIIIPHSILVYYLPMFFIFYFYSKTIRIVSQKVKKRRLSTVSIKYLTSVVAQDAEENNCTTNNDEIALAVRNSIINSRRLNSDDIASICHESTGKEPSLIIENTYLPFSSNLDSIKEPNFVMPNPPDALSNKIIIKRDIFADEDDLPDSKIFKISLRRSLKRSFKIRRSKKFEGHSMPMHVRPYSSLNNLSSLKEEDFQNRPLKPLSPILSSSNNLHCETKVNLVKKLDDFAKPSCESLKKSTGSILNACSREFDIAIVSPCNSKTSSNVTLKNDPNVGILKKSCMSIQNGINNNPQFKKKLSFGNSFIDLSDRRLTRTSNLVNAINLGSNKSSNNSECTLGPENLSVNNTDYRRRKVSLCQMSAASKGLSNCSNRERNVTYKLGFILFMFLVCWLPFSLLWPLMSICATCINESFYIFSFWLAYANSIFTPLILLYNNAKYRQGIFIIKNFFCRLFSSNDSFDRKRSMFLSHNEKILL